MDIHVRIYTRSWGRINGDVYEHYNYVWKRKSTKHGIKIQTEKKKHKGTATLQVQQQIDMHSKIKQKKPQKIKTVS